MIKLSIIILNFNTKDYLKQAISSIGEKKDFEIIVVDNNSNDGSVEMVEKKFSKVKLIKSKKNVGFAVGNNMGIRKAKGKYIMLLNSDTKVINGALEKLVGYMDENKSVGVVTPKLLLSDGAIDMACHRGLPTIGNSLAYFLKLEQLMPNSKLFGGYHQTYKDFNSVHEVEAVSGAALLTRRKVIDEVGLLDEDFFLYGEDLDWCKRIYEAGWKIVYNPNAKIIHYKKRSGREKDGVGNDNKLKKSSRRYFIDTMKQYYLKHNKSHPRIIKKIVLLGIRVLSRNNK